MPPIKQLARKNGMTGCPCCNPWGDNPTPGKRKSTVDSHGVTVEVLVDCKRCKGIGWLPDMDVSKVYMGRY